MKAVTLTTLVLLIASVQGVNLFPNFCNGLFPPGSSGTGLGSASVYTSLMSVSLLIVLVVLTILGVVYAFGYAFGIDSLKTFTKSEFIESFFNILLIILISSGLAFAGGAIAFISNLGMAGAESPSSACAAAAPAVHVSSTEDVYMAICQNYIENGVSIAIVNIFPATMSSFLLNALKSLKVELDPWYFGVVFSPFAGITPIITLIDLQISVFYATVGIFAGIALLLFVIYSLFPVFLYVGVLLRSFPWTRAAGGSLLALFIAFYIIFPALLYPFSTYKPCITAPDTSGFTGALFSGGLSSIFSISAVLAGVHAFFDAGDYFVAEMGFFADIITMVGLQLLGIIIAFIVSLDLVEDLGDILGAPSLGPGHTRNLLKRVI